MFTVTFTYPYVYTDAVTLIHKKMNDASPILDEDFQTQT